MLDMRLWICGMLGILIYLDESRLVYPVEPMVGLLYRHVPEFPLLISFAISHQCLRGYPLSLSMLYGKNIKVCGALVRQRNCVRGDAIDRVDLGLVYDGSRW